MVIASTGVITMEGTSMKNKIVLLCIVAVLILAGAFAIRSLTLSRRITSTPVIVSSEDGLFKVNEDGKSTKLIDTRKDFSSIWSPGFYKNDFIYTGYGSPVTSIRCLDTTTHQSRILTEGLAAPFGDPILVNNRVIFISSNPYCIWSVDLDDSSKVNLAKGLGSPKLTGQIGSTESDYVVTKDTKWIIFIAYDPALKKDCYFSSTPDGSQLVNLTGDVSLPLTAFDSAAGPCSPEFTALSDDGTKVCFSFASGEGLTYIVAIDGSSRVTLPWGSLVAFANNNTEVILLRDDSANQSGGRSIWGISADGKTQMNLTKDLDGDCYEVKLGPSQDEVFFTFALRYSQRDSLWSMNSDGSKKTNLTDKAGVNLFSNPQSSSFIPEGNKILAEVYNPDSGLYSLLILDLESGAATKLTGDGENTYTSLHASRNGKHILVTGTENSWLVNVDDSSVEALDSNFGGYPYSIQNDYLAYKDKDNTLYCLDLSSGKRLKIKDDFSAAARGIIAVDSKSKDVLISSLATNGAEQYSLLNMQNHKFTDLSEIVEGTLDFAAFFQ